MLRDQFTAIIQFCDQPGLCIGQTEQGSKAVLKREGVTSPTGEHLEDVKKKAAEEFVAILFLYMADWHRYGKIIEDM